MEASFSPVDGSSVSKYSPEAGACQTPLMKWAKRRPWRSSQPCDSLGSSGAGPYSMVRNFSAILIQFGSILQAFAKARRVSLSSFKQSDDDIPRNTVRSHDVPVDARYLRASCWHQSETVPRASTINRVLLSSWRASPWTALRFEVPRRL